MICAALGDATIDEAILVAAALQELGGRSPGVALAALQDMADSASFSSRSSGVA